MNIFLTSFLGIQNVKIFVFATTMVLFAGFVPFFEQNVYFSFTCALLFNLSMLADVVTAIVLAHVRGGGFETRLGMKALAKFIGYNYLLYLSDAMTRMFANSEVSKSFWDGLSAVMSSGASDAVKSAFNDYHLSPYSVFLYAFITISFSVLKNLQLCDAFQSLSSFEGWLYRNIDVYKNRSVDRLWNSLSVDTQRSISKKK